MFPTLKLYVAVATEQLDGFSRQWVSELFTDNSKKIKKKFFLITRGLKFAKIYLIKDSVEMKSQPAVGVIPLGTGSLYFLINFFYPASLEKDSRTEVQVCFLHLGNDLARCLRWGGGYEGESIPKLLEKLARSDSVMMDRWNISIAETKSDKDETLTIPSHKVLKVSKLLFYRSLLRRCVSLANIILCENITR